VLVLRGEAGVGKSALLEYLTGQVGGCRVISAVGVESEMELAFNGLHQLCLPVLDGLGRLPEPQRAALETVFGLRDGSAPDRFLVGLATLTLLAEAAERQPLICIVDDAQWLDHASEQVLGFVARRLQAERIAIVCAARTGIGDRVLAGLPVLAVAGLRDADARSLLMERLNGPLDAEVCDQIIAESHGNHSRSSSCPAPGRAQTWRAASDCPIHDRSPTRSNRATSGGCFRCPPTPRWFFSPQRRNRSATRSCCTARCAPLASTPIAANPAADAALLQIRERVEFTHPLVRSAVYRAAAADDRQRVRVMDHRRSLGVRPCSCLRRHAGCRLAGPARHACIM
jgi:hypothetical protein